eukprot:gene23664-biopygen14887
MPLLSLGRANRKDSGAAGAALGKTEKGVQRGTDRRRREPGNGQRFRGMESTTGAIVSGTRRRPNTPSVGDKERGGLPAGCRPRGARWKGCPLDATQRVSAGCHPKGARWMPPKKVGLSGGRFKVWGRLYSGVPLLRIPLFRFAVDQSILWRFIRHCDGVPTPPGGGAGCRGTVLADTPAAAPALQAPRPPAVAAGRVFAVASSAPGPNITQTLYAINASTGAELWRVVAGTIHGFQNCPAADGNAVYSNLSKETGHWCKKEKLAPISHFHRRLKKSASA